MADKIELIQGTQKPAKKENSDKRESKSFVVDLGSENQRKKPHIHSLQAAFLKFRRDRQSEIRQIRLMKHRQTEEARNPMKMQLLRDKFVEQAKKYFGVPYAKKYWKSEDAEYNSPIFLDCCGLVRQVVRDLSEDFGFQMGMWNQAYMFDTLPIVLTEDEMKPGDLVFISATYFNPKSKKQRHDMVHVEIWLGDGPQTIGARWQKGKVQIFPRYSFEAKSYHSESYHFRSIDTWLMGICQSFCSEHPWRRSAYDPSRMSIFSPDVDSNGESAGDTDNELVEDDTNDTPSSKQISLKVKYTENLKHQDLVMNGDSNFFREELKCKDTQNIENLLGGSGGMHAVNHDPSTNQMTQYLLTNETEDNLHNTEDSSWPCSKGCHCMLSSLSFDEQTSEKLENPENETAVGSCDKLEGADKSLRKKNLTGNLDENLDDMEDTSDEATLTNTEIRNKSRSWLEDTLQSFPIQSEEEDTCSLVEDTGDHCGSSV